MARRQPQRPDVNATDPQGRTELHHWAASSEASSGDVAGKRSEIRALLRAGADPTRRDRWKRTPIDVAVDFGHLETLELFALLLPGSVTDAHRKRARENRFTEQCGSTNLRAIQAFVRGGGDVNVVDARGWSALHHAAFWGKSAMVEALVAAGADPNLLGRKKVPPLFEAALQRQWGTVATLVAAGADPHFRDARKRTLWEIAAEDPDALPKLRGLGLAPPANPTRSRPRPGRSPFGRSPPASIRVLRAWRDRCEKDGLSPRLLSLELLEVDFRCEVTPPDLVPFACTGGDGIHFGILTDFGTATSLDQASIVCVSPTNDPPVKLVAGSLPEFVALVCRTQDAEALDELPERREDEAAWLANVRDRRDSDDPAIRKARRELVARLKKAFHLSPVRSVVQTVMAARRARSERLAIETDDGLGVLPFRRRPNQQHRLERNEPALGADPAQLAAFVKTARPEAVLALVRDAPSRLFPAGSIAVLVRFLASLGLKDESARFQSQV